MTPTSSRDLAVNYLRYWYKASPVSSFPSIDYVSYPDFIAKYDDGTFLESLGAALSSIRQDKVQQGFEALAKKNPRVPMKAEFFDALAASVGNFTLGDAASAAGEGVVAAGKTVATIGGIALGGYGIYLLIAGALILLPMLARVKKEAKAL